MGISHFSRNTEKGKNNKFLVSKVQGSQKVLKDLEKSNFVRFDF